MDAEIKKKLEEMRSKQHKELPEHLALTWGQFPEYNIPGVSKITSDPITVTTDGGPWAEHNFPCPVCKKEIAVMELDGWRFGPCRSCENDGWVLHKPTGWKRFFI